MNINDFLDRIRFKGEVDTSIECLAKLQEQFIKTIPFENVDIINKIPLNYSVAAVFDKIVKRNRGGVCYETNSLLYWALTTLGFDVKIVEAEMFPEETIKNKFYHMALVVSLDEGLFLVDVGNGKYFGPPLDITGRFESEGEGIRYQIMDYHDDYIALCWSENNEWKIRYVFHLEPKTLSDFEVACKFTETSEESAFTKNILATLLSDEYRITLSGNSLTKTYADQEQQKIIINDAERDKILHDVFGISNLP